MTTAPLAAPAARQPRRPPLISLADLFTAVAELAPADPDRAREIAALLGLGPVPARVTRPPEPAAPPPEPATPAPGPAPAPAVPATEPRAAPGIVPSQLREVAEPGSPVEDGAWLEAVAPLGPRAPEQAREAPAVEPLFEPRWTVGIVFAALATNVAGRADLARAVEALARGRPLARIPSRPRPSLRRGAQVLVDLGAGMEPFRQDQESFVAALRRTLGAERVDVLQFADCPGRDAGAPGAGWAAYRAPRSGVPVVLLTDLGLGSVPGEARPAEWRAFLDEVGAEGSPCVAFVPYPPDRVPRVLRAAVLVVRWDRPTTAGWVRQRRTGAHR